MRLQAAWTAAIVLHAAIPAAGQTPARKTALEFPVGLALLPDGGLLIAERRTHRIQRFDPARGTLTVVAGTGASGFNGDGGPARQAALACPDAIDADRHGNVYVADRCNERIRRIDARTGIITTVAGTGRRGPGPDGAALTVDLTGVFYLRVVDDRRILFTDTDAHLVRELDLAAGTVRTVAGSGEGGFAGEGGPARSAALSRPHVALRLRNGDLVIGDSFNHRVRLVEAATGTVRTIAGSGQEAPAEDGAPALTSPLLYFGEIHELPDGDLLWSEWGSSQLVRLDRSTGRLRVVAGSPAAGPVAPARAGIRGQPLGAMADVVVDPQGRLIVAVAREGLVRRIDLSRGTVETLAGREAPPR